MDEFKVTAIVLAAGRGKRMESTVHKQYLLIKDKQVLYYSLKAFEDSQVDDIVLVVGKGEQEFCRKEILDKYNFHKIKAIVEGGKERYHSVAYGIQAICLECKYVLIHDGARPYFSNQLLTQLKLALKSHDCVIPVISLNDSIKKVSNHKVEYSLNREEYKLVQCPQGFLTKQIKLAHSLAKKGDYTDDSSLIEDILHQEVFCINGERKNRKYTNEEDF